MSFLYALLLFVFLVGTNILFRKSKYASAAFFFVLPAMLAFWWYQQSMSTFYWAKIGTMLFAIMWLQLCRFTTIFEKKWVKIVAFLLLSLNILEAVLKDVSAGATTGYLNALAGILLIASLPRINSMSVDHGSKHKDFLWDLPMLWIIGYTVWNWLFVYLNYPENIGRTSILLAAALVVAFQDRKRWLQSRMFTLTTYLIVLFSWSDLARLINTGHWYNGSVAMVSAVISVLIGAMCTYNFYKK